MDDDEHAFDFGVSAAPASLQTHNEIWADIKHRCREMSSAKTKKNRGPALMEFQNMVSSLKHQQVLHASGTWSFVITALIQVIEVDFSALLKKKHATGGDFKLDHEATMNNLLDYAHTHTSPASSTAVLDRDTVGRTALKRLVSFCEAILVKPSLEQTPAEGSALRILDKLFRFNAYCRAVDESKLKKVLERVLYVLNDRTSSNLLLASRIALSILTNFQSDLHTRLPGFMEFFHQWFQDIRSEAEGSRLPHPSYGRSVSVDAVARNVLSCMVVLMRQYGPHMVPLLQVHAHEVVQYVLYNLKDDVVVLSTEPAEFLIMYYRLSLQSLLMKLLEDGKLEAECKEQTLQCLLSLALYMPNENGSSSWHRLWQTLLSDYSFRNMTKFESGDVVVQLLSALVALNYVSAAMLECDLAAILEFPVFSSPSAYFFKTLAQQSFARDGIGHATPLLVSAIGSIVSSDVPDVDDDEVDTSRWASVAFKKSQSRLWCLRIHQLLQYEQRRASMSSQSSKQEDSAQLIRQVVEQNYVSAFQCLALIPSLGRPLTNEGLATIVFLLQSTLVSHPVEVCEHLEHVAVAISRQQFKGTSASYDLGVVFDTLLELRKTKKSPRHLRRALILAYEQLFLMDVDRFVDFSDYMMASFLDHDIGVQVASLSVLQSAYAKYDEGVVAIFHDVESLLKNQASHMIVAALACFISAGSADVLLSRVLALYSLWFDAEPELFRACTDGLATLYGYETPLSMLEDMCWPTLCHYAELGPQLKAKRDLSQFPMALFGESLVRLTESHLVPSFASLVLLLNESNQDFHHLDNLNIPNVTELKPSVLVVLAWAKQKSTPCAVTPEMTLTILHYLLNLNAYAAETYPLQWCTFEAMVCRPVNLVDIALMLHAWLGEHRLKSLATEPIKFLCEAVDALSTGSSNGHAISQRIVLHVLLQHAQIFDVVCALKRVCDQWARDPDVFGQNVNFLICGLVLRYTALPMKNQEVVEDIAHAISRVQKLGKFLAKLNPFPSNISPGLNQLQRSYSTDEPVIQTLAEKFTRPLLQTSPLTTEGLRSLQDIVVSNADEQHVPTIVHGLLAKAYQNALRENDTDKQVQIATCLGLMGAVFPADILSHDVGRLEVLYLQLFSRPSLAALSKAKDAWLELLGKLLECLILMFFESDGKVVHIAHNTVKALLQLEEVQVAVDHMKSHSHGLKTFLQNIPSAMLPPRPPPLVPTTSRWSPADHASFREWVCHVCCLLIKQSRHPTLAVCLEMCAFHERIAVFLLPLAIYFVLGTDATELVMLEQLLVQESSLPLKHGQVLVQTINYVRHLQMIKSQHASWSLPYLQVAQLALRCKMPYSALQYVELHLEQTFGTIQPDDRLSSDVTNILLQAYKEINAVDAIDGVRQVGHSFADQLAIYTLEKKFSDCLPLYDAISRQEGTQTHHNGLAKTLHSLGYTNLLETYLSTHDSSGISKFQYQMAWKQNQWSLKAPAATTPTSANFHGLLYGCLKSMATNDGHQFHQLVVQAKTSILASQDLSFTGAPWLVALVWQLKLAQAARQAKRVAIAIRALNELETMPMGPMERISFLMEKANLYYSIKESYRALEIAKTIHKHLTTNQDNNGLALAHVNSTIGQWLAEMKAERSEVIQTKYLSAATQIFETMDSGLQCGKEASRAYRMLADYTFDMYNQVKTRVESKEWKRGKKVAEAQEAELRLFDASAGAQKAHTRHGVLRKQVYAALANGSKFTLAPTRQVEYDKKERHAVESSVDKFLTIALKNYGLSLRFTADGDMTPVFRILSLWFRHFQNPVVNEQVDEIIRIVPSYKFIPLSYQVISRLGTSHPSIQELVRKLTTEHPHHTIVQLLALKNGSKRGTAAYRDNIGVLKSDEAVNVLTFVKRASSTLAALVENMEVLCDAYITLALHDTKEYERRGMKKIALANILVGRDRVPFDNCLRLRKFNQAGLARPAVLTYAIKPRSDGDYSNVPRVQSFEKEFTVTDSVMAVQDLVIEQAFDMVNSFLNDDPNTRGRHLQIKTYKVTPLDTVAGVLEWVDNTMPMGGYLNGKPMDAHMRYHPDEWKHVQCRSYLQKATDKYQAFMEIQAHFTPVFHHYFLEKYPDPATWYARREAYTRSVAVTSIVGHILGIGDRHSQNILIDEASGELVHIDFGVVFDQETLKVLRKKGNALSTIVEVFIHDPLYNWTLSPGRALQVQKDKMENDLQVARADDKGTDDDENVADLAARVLLRVKQKLQGYEDPTSEAMSVEGQVKHLIQVARDPHNLCKIYPGWGPWL
ncbi:hypothetical protein DYB32_001375 [Aphanomyces invadans]|uniref:non-specific serine/threonine protein kinase n=1 Tax=Aphanomyces invadans TaxID=157072 RepID=A0A3R6VS90_9STRA|nr:hypothetical protein DYB32_001375 [Aphanomyces invadans]